MAAFLFLSCSRLCPRAGFYRGICLTLARQLAIALTVAEHHHLAGTWQGRPCELQRRVSLMVRTGTVSLMNCMKSRACSGKS